MPRIELTTVVNAAATTCFDLIRDRRVQPKIIHIDGRAGLGQRVTFAISMGLTLVTEVTEYRNPVRIVDTMTDGPFRSFTHAHDLRSIADGTIMVDTLDWVTPCGRSGAIFDALIVQRRIRQLVSSRNRRLKEIAEDAGS